MPEHMLYHRCAHARQRSARHCEYFGFLIGLAGGVMLLVAIVTTAEQSLSSIMLHSLGVVSLFLGMSHLYVRHYERLVLLPTGLAYRSPLPRPLAWLRPSWELQWAEIRSVAVQPPMRQPDLTMVLLVFETANRKRALRPLQWIAPHGRDQLPAKQLTRVLHQSADQELSERLHNTPVLRHLEAAGLQVELDTAALRASVASGLEDNPRVVTALCLIIVLLFYAVTDSMIRLEAYVHRAYWEWYGGLGLVAAYGSFAWLRQVNVPAVESVGLACLLGGALVFALHPGTLRLNQLTDATGLRPYTYVLQPDRSLKPQHPALPSIRLYRCIAYWQQHKAGSLHHLHLRQGGLGFYQINLAPLYAKIEAFYAESGAQ